MRVVLALLRWCLLLTPVGLTATWVHASAAGPTATPFDVGATDVLPRATPRAATSVPRPSIGDAVDSALVHRAAGRQARPSPCSTSAGEPPPIDPEAVPRAFMGPAPSHAVALTFDDGPSRENTPRILEILAEHEVPATFFVLGNRAESMGDLLAQIDAAGHEIGNHGYSHASLRSLGPSEVHDEACKTDRLIESAIGRRPALFRPPFGRFSPTNAGQLGGLGYGLVLWSVDAEDWKYDDPSEMARAVVDAAHSGSIILLHDRESITVRALPGIIDGLRRRGLEPVLASALTDLPPYQTDATRP